MSNKNFDEGLSSIQNLKWLPWIGPNILEVPQEKRMMIVGESHYLDSKNKSEEEISYDYRNKNSEDYTRRVSSEFREGDYSKNTTHRNFFKAISFENPITPQSFWDRVVYHNLIQEPLRGIDIRPTSKQYSDGWLVLNKVIEVIKPSVMIFLGNSGSKHFPKNLLNEISIRTFQKINGAYPKIGSWNLKSGETISAIFIKHPSSHFSPNKWNEFLFREIGEKLDWLK